MATLRIRIDKKGGTIVKVEGCPGPSCKDLTKNLEKALGVRTADIDTDEINDQQTSQGQTQDQGN